MIEIKEIPQKYVFTKDMVVKVNSKLKSGIGKVVLAYYPTEQPKSELSYSLSYDEPFPQIYILFEDGEKIRYNADDLLAGKIIKTDEVFHIARKLRTFLSKLMVDTSQAAYDLGEFSNYVDSNKSMLDIIYSSPLYLFIKPLFEKEVYSNTHKGIELGEFDNHTYIFSSVKVGQAMRNSGIPAFTLHITIDGYAPPTMKLETTEIFQE